MTEKTGNYSVVVTVAGAKGIVISKTWKPSLTRNIAMIFFKKTIADIVPAARRLWALEREGYKIL